MSTLCIMSVCHSTSQATLHRKPVYVLGNGNTGALHVSHTLCVCFLLASECFLAFFLMYRGSMVHLRCFACSSEVLTQGQQEQGRQEQGQQEQGRQYEEVRCAACIHYMNACVSRTSACTARVSMSASSGVACSVRDTPRHV